MIPPRIPPLAAAAYFLCATLMAQPSPAPHPAQPGPSAPAPTQEPAYKPHRASPETVVFTVEVYSLPQDAAAQILEQTGTGEARHNAVLALMANGKARLETLLSTNAEPGQRTVVESVDEVRYPTEFTGLPTSDRPNFASAYESRDVGDSLEIELDSDHSGKLFDFYMVLARVRLLGFPFVPAGPEKPGSIPQPHFQQARIITTLGSIPASQTFFLGTLSNPPQFQEDSQKPSPNNMHLAFGRIDPVDSTSFTPAPPDLAAAPRQTIEMEFSLYSMDREAARRILTQGFQGDSCYNAVTALVAAHQAKLERITEVLSTSGQRVRNDELDEVRYATEYGSHVTGTNGNATPYANVGPRSIQTRNAGSTLEIEPQLDASSKNADLLLVPDITTDEGEFQVPGAIAKDEPAALFEDRKITTALTTPIGRHAFIGTFSHPGEDGVNGRKDTGRTWFGFIRATLPVAQAQ